MASQANETKERNIIQFKDEKDEVRFSIASEKVVYIESSDNYCIIKYINNDKISDFVLRNSLKRLSSELENTSIQRCHRSYMINFEHIASLKRDNSEISFEFDIPNIKEIPISKSYSEKIMELFVISKQK
jgi:DNA-binding LytR/AlgR family response regulator